MTIQTRYFLIKIKVLWAEYAIIGIIFKFICSFFRRYYFPTENNVCRFPENNVHAEFIWTRVFICTSAFHLLYLPVDHPLFVYAILRWCTYVIELLFTALNTVTNETLPWQYRFYWCFIHYWIIVEMQGMLVKSTS